MERSVRITYRPTNLTLAEGPLGWGITPFEGSLYVARKHLRTDGFTPNFIPGLCPYKFLYVWLDFRPPEGPGTRNLGWLYWFPNPLLPFIWYRVAVPRRHPALEIEEFSQPAPPPSG